MEPPRLDAPGKFRSSKVSDSPNSMGRYGHYAAETAVVVVDKRDPQHWRQRRLQVHVR